MSTVADAARRRRSRSKVTDVAPTHEQLLDAVRSAATVADHSELRPWRLLEFRGDDRMIVGRSLAEASGAEVMAISGASGAGIDAVLDKLIGAIGPAPGAPKELEEGEVPVAWSPL